MFGFFTMNSNSHVDVPLSDETKKRVRALFGESEYFAVESLLIKKCGNNLYFKKNIIQQS